MQIDLNYSEPIPVSLEPAKTMLLIVDMENEDATPLESATWGRQWSR